MTTQQNSVTDALLIEVHDLFYPALAGESDDDKIASLAKNGAAHRVAARLEAALASPVEDGGEPVAWAWEANIGGELLAQVDLHRPHTEKWKVNIRPLYALSSSPGECRSDDTLSAPDNTHQGGPNE